MRRFIFASHHYLAYGLKDTVDFLTNKAKTIYDINAYAEDKEQNLESSCLIHLILRMRSLC